MKATRPTHFRFLLGAAMALTALLARADRDDHGTNANDVIFGTNGTDVIVAKEGDDTRSTLSGAATGRAATRETTTSLATTEMIG